MRTLFLVLVLSACAGAPSAEAPSAEPVIAAERAFAADAAERGWAAAFRSHAAADAITLSPDPINAHEALARVEGDGETTLDWRPAFAGVSRSGDFGFTTGPFLFRGRDGIVGHYFTVWRRQPNGAWKWIFDAGTGVRDSGPPVAVGARIPTLPVALDAAASEAHAVAEVARIELQISESASTAEALTRSLAHDVRVNRQGAEAAIGRAPAAALVADGGDLAYAGIQMWAASSGDIVFSLGAVRDNAEAAAPVGYYARIWQRRPEGWRIVFDEIAPRRR